MSNMSAGVGRDDINTSNEKGGDKKMKRKNIAGLIAIVAIVAVAIFAGCIEDNSEKPTKRELEIYDAYYKAVFAEPDVPEAVIKERVAKEYGISTEELDKIWRKVWAYKNRE